MVQKMTGLARFAFGFVLLVMPAVHAVAQKQHGGTIMHATGKFEVKTEPQKDDGADPKLVRMTIDKQFTGDLDATSKGQMLSAGTDVKGSAGYVAMEKVTGKLHEKSGSFILQHAATMDQGGAESQHHGGS